jgi:Mg2+ and Co2+ transporter CorA
MPPTTKPSALSKDDLDGILKVSAQAIELKLQIADQYEDIVEGNEKVASKVDSLTDRLNTMNLRQSQIDDLLIKHIAEDEDTASEMKQTLVSNHTSFSMFQKDFSQAQTEQAREHKELGEKVSKLSDTVKEMKDMMFKLSILLGSSVAGLIYELVKSYFHH